MKLSKELVLEKLKAGEESLANRRKLWEEERRLEKQKQSSDLLSYIEQFIYKTVNEKDFFGCPFNITPYNAPRTISSPSFRSSNGEEWGNFYFTMSTTDIREVLNKKNEEFQNNGIPLKLSITDIRSSWYDVILVEKI